MYIYKAKADSLRTARRVAFSDTAFFLTEYYALINGEQQVTESEAPFRPTIHVGAIRSPYTHPDTNTHPSNVKPLKTYAYMQECLHMRGRAYVCVCVDCGLFIHGFRVKYTCSTVDMCASLREKLHSVLILNPLNFAT